MNGLKYISLYESSGYGISARKYLQILLEKQIPFSWTPMIAGPGLGLGYEPYAGKECDWPELVPACNKKINYDRVLVHTVPEYLPYWIKKETGKKIYCYTVWETDKLPRHWPALLNATDHIIVPCTWNKDVFRNSGVKVHISVLPHVSEYAETLFTEEPEQLNTIPPNHYAFYTIGDWTTRKNIEQTLTCFLNTFTAQDTVTLIIKTSALNLSKRNNKLIKFHTKNTVKKILKKYKTPANVILITRKLTKNELLGLHKRGNCYLSLCHGEGWGYGAYDAAFQGNPVIMTGYGGHLDYLKKDLAYLVDYSLIPVKDSIGKKSYSPDQNWAHADSEDASRKMKEVVLHRNQAQEKGTKLKTHLNTTFSKETITKTLLDILDHS